MSASSKTTPLGWRGAAAARRSPRAREGIAYLWIEALGRAGRPLAAALGVRPQSIYAAAARGRTARGRWIPILAKLI